MKNNKINNLYLRTGFLVLLVLFCVNLSTYGATIVVDTTADENDTNPANCSLREAVRAANLNSPLGGCPAGSGTSDTITFDATVFRR